MTDRNRGENWGKERRVSRRCPVHYCLVHWLSSRLYLTNNANKLSKRELESVAQHYGYI